MLNARVAPRVSCISAAIKVSKINANRLRPTVNVDQAADAAKERLLKEATFESTEATRALLSSTTFKGADVLSTDSATLLDIVNVLGRWTSCEEWKVRTSFTDAAPPAATTGEFMGGGPSFDVEAQVGSRERYEMAQRLGMCERLAFQQNVPKLTFRDAALAEGFGLGTSDFAAMAVNPVAVDIVYDALAESKQGLIQASTIDARRARFFRKDGSFHDGKFALALYKSRMLTGTAFLAKPALYAAVTFQMFMMTTATVGTDVAASMQQ